MGARRRALALAACDRRRAASSVRQGTGSSYLIVDELAAASGAEPDSSARTLQSDVITVVDERPTVFTDLGQVTFQLGHEGSAAGPRRRPRTRSPSIAYRVEYVRADGRNTQGVDVPYRFDGAFTATVAGGDA